MELPSIDQTLLARIMSDPAVIQQLVSLNGCLTHEAGFGIQYHLLQDQHHITPLADGEETSVEVDWEGNLPKGWASLPLFHYHTHVSDTLLLPTGWEGDVASAHQMRSYDWNAYGLDFRAIHGITRHQRPSSPWEILLYQEFSPELLPLSEMKPRTQNLFEESFYEEAEQADVVEAMRGTGVYHCEHLTLHRRKDTSRFFPEEELEKLRSFSFQPRIIDERKFQKNYLSKIRNTL